MASFWPTIRFSRVDLPAFGRPRRATKPDFMGGFGYSGTRSVLRLIDGFLPAADTDLADATALDFEHFERELVHLERLTDVRHPSQMREQEPADGLESLPLDLHAEALV